MDPKNPPKFPFLIQAALRSSLDVFYFNIHCMLHVLIDTNSPMTSDEFKKFWEMIPKANETSLSISNLYEGFNSNGDFISNLTEGLKANNITQVAKVPKKD